MVLFDEQTALYWPAIYMILYRIVIQLFTVTIQKELYGKDNQSDIV